MLIQFRHLRDELKQKRDVMPRQLPVSLMASGCLVTNFNIMMSKIGKIEKELESRDAEITSQIKNAEKMKKKVAEIGQCKLMTSYLNIRKLIINY